MITQYPQPAFATRNLPICFCTDLSFVPYFSVALQSILDTSTDAWNYDIIILATDLSETTKVKLAHQIAERPNISLRYFNMASLVQQYDADSWPRTHRMSSAVYYRLFIPVIFQQYDKILYLDSDILVKADLGDLFMTDMEGYLLAAVRDFADRYHSASVRQDFGRTVVIKDYIENVMGLGDVEDYFNSGVLIMNIAEINRRALFEEFLKFAAANYCLIAHDQNVLNAVCKGAVLHLDKCWNVQWHVDFSPQTTFMSHEEIADLFLTAKILHFTSRKPPERPENALVADWWECARKTPFYDSLIFFKTVQILIESSIQRVNKRIDKFEANMANRSIRHALEERCIKYFCSNEAKLLKYSQNRNAFFEDSKNVFMKFYYKLLG
jgi:lipopolysaccharide biosynthesis glycosyltransferase